MKVGQYIKTLIKSRGMRASDLARAIGVSRQQLSYAITGARELSLPLALEIESYFNLPEGKLVKWQAEDNVKKYKAALKLALAKKLIGHNAFWSYSSVKPEDISDEDLIEKTFIHLDMPEIAMLFEVYSRQYLKKVWKERLAIQGDYLYDLNVMIALYYFDIKNPERYLKYIENEHFRKYA